MKKILIVALFLSAGLAAAPSSASAGATSCQCYCGSWIAPPCSDQACINHCGGSSGSSSSQSDVRFGNVFTGHKTKDNFSRMGETCGSNPLCMVMNTMAILIVGMVTDVPYYVVKAPVMLVKGLGKGAKLTGKAIASPFKASASKRRAKNHSLAYSAAPGCSGSEAYGNPMPTFNAYQAWEECKRAVLKRQKALTKLNPSNKENETWCKTRIPLGFGPNRLAWEERCNAGGNAGLVNDPKAVEAERAKALANTGAGAAAGGAAPAGEQTPASGGEPQAGFTTPPAVDGAAAPGTTAPQAGGMGASNGTPAQTGYTIGTGATPSNALVPFPPGYTGAPPTGAAEQVSDDGKAGWDKK